MGEQFGFLNKKLAQIYFRVGEIETAMALIQCGQKMCERIYGESHVETFECYNLLSQFYFFVNNFETAEYYLLKAIHLSTLAYGEEYPELIIAYLNLSTVYETTSRFMDSITSSSHALRIVLRVFG
jgi:tetratricopeptide (TPR) repeat protein